ncbi:MAG: KEOPS complex kinase/ATPase Bud32 [Methanobacteriota archaeon]
MEIYRRGAEAELCLADWKGRKAVVKHRVPKGYRLAELDERIRRQRMRAEVRLVASARKAGVLVPVIYDADVANHKIIMQFIEGPQAKEAIDAAKPAERKRLCRELGRCAGKLHKADIIHGDFTTSNVIVADGLYMIDFSMGELTPEAEKKAVDLHLLKEAFQSAHSAHMDCFESVLEGYRAEFPGAREIEKVVGQVEKRGRYHEH